jgi:hypothetical protein
LKYKQIDLDTKDIDKVRSVRDLLSSLNIHVTMCIETRGGFHMLFPRNANKDTMKSLYEFKQKTSSKKPDINGKIVTDYWFSITNQPMVIMPGTYQGGFPAKIVDLNDWLNK